LASFQNEIRAWLAHKEANRANCKAIVEKRNIVVHAPTSGEECRDILMVHPLFIIMPLVLQDYCRILLCKLNISKILVEVF
jgi:hypothetical protein